MSRSLSELEMEYGKTSSQRVETAVEENGRCKCNYVIDPLTAISIFVLRQRALLFGDFTQKSSQV